MDFVARAFHFSSPESFYLHSHVENSRQKKNRETEWQRQDKKENNNDIFVFLSVFFERTAQFLFFFTNLRHRRVMLHFEHRLFPVRIPWFFRYPFELQLATKQKQNVFSFEGKSSTYHKSWHSSEFKVGITSQFTC